MNYFLTIGGFSNFENLVRFGDSKRNKVQPVLTKITKFITTEEVPSRQCQFVPLFEDKMYYANCLYEMLTALERELLKKKIYCLVENRKTNSNLGYSSQLIY